MQLKGKRILIDVPEKKESSIELTEKDKAMIEEAEMKKWTQLKVHAVGDLVTEFKPGNLVYLSVPVIQDAERILIDGQIKMMINEASIAIVW